MQAVEHSLIDDVDNMTDHEKKISDLFGIDFSLNESVKAIEVISCLSIFYRDILVMQNGYLQWIRSCTNVISTISNTFLWS